MNVVLEKEVFKQQKQQKTHRVAFQVNEATFKEHTEGGRGAEAGGEKILKKIGKEKNVLYMERYTYLVMTRG